MTDEASKIPKHLLVLAEEINTLNPGWVLAVCSNAGQTEWKLEIRNRTEWTGGKLSQVTMLAEKHGCELLAISAKGTAILVAL